MAENVRLEEIIEISRNSVEIHGANMSNIRHIPSLLMTHSINVSQSGQTVNTRTFNIGARAVEHLLTHNLSSTFEEIRPLIQNVQVHLQSLQVNQVRINSSANDSYIINLEDQTNDTTNVQPQPTHDHHHHQTMTTDNFLNNILEVANEVAAETLNNYNNNNNNSNTNEVPQSTFQIRPETRELLKVLQRYVPFILILLIKVIYDFKGGIFTFIVLNFTSAYTNNNLKQEISKQHNRSWTSLILIVFSILGCIAFVSPIVEICIFTGNTQPLTYWELLWSIVLTDFVLKLITIIIKAILTCLPAKLLDFHKRGKYYLVIEATSQLYRYVAPVQPTFYYLEPGPEKILNTFLFVVYTISKINTVLPRLKLFCTAVWKLLQNKSLEATPSKEELANSGGICAICRDEYSMPVRLHCRHIFCKACVSAWFDRERSCPLCRAVITDDSVYQNGHTALFIQTY